jgi:hypothetical protein
VSKEYIMIIRIMVLSVINKMKILLMVMMMITMMMAMTMCDNGGISGDASADGDKEERNVTKLCNLLLSINNKYFKENQK